MQVSRSAQFDVWTNIRCRQDSRRCKMLVLRGDGYSVLTIVEPLDIVVDVGGVYSPEKHRYDHHQRGFTEVFGHGGYDKIKLSSAGLVYK